MWSDAFGRTARKLRVSVTDRCNLRCVYCMPERPVWLPRAELLSYEELARLVRIAAAHGVDAVRVTGGEPLVRRDLHRFIALLKRIPGLREIALTTNGLLLAEQARSLKDAGLDRLTVSLDSLDSERFRRLARRDGLDETLRGIAAAESAGLVALKINAVVIRGVNDAELPELAAWGRETGRQLRFIEFMPLDGDRLWDRTRLVPGAEIVRRIAERFPVRPRGARPGGATASVYDYADGKGSFGVIASVSEPFCGDCDRVRLTADGELRNCLFAQEGTDLRGPLRGGASDAELAERMRATVARKAAGHLISLPGFRPPGRPMHAIGG